MSLVRWDPMRELEEMADRLERVVGHPLFRRTNDGKETLTVPDWVPAVDIVETPGEYLVTAALPEVKKDDIRVTVVDGILRIGGERTRVKEEEGRKFHRMEQAYGRFVRTFAVPDEVDGAKVQAEFKDGVLTVHLPKTGKPQPKTFEVKVA